jgi:hypothetical protein
VNNGKDWQSRAHSMPADLQQTLGNLRAIAIIFFQMRTVVVLLVAVIVLASGCGLSPRYMIYQ